MRKANHQIDFATSRSGVAAVEFAVIFPVLLILMLGGFQLIAFINATRKVGLIASSISEMISQAAPPIGSTVATVNSLDIHFSWDSTMVIFPYVMTDAARQGMPWWQDITVEYASIQFTKTSTDCDTSYDQSSCYVANVVWTSPGTGPNYRPCVVPQLPTTSTVPVPTKIPSNVFGSDSVIAIDVVFNFIPTFGYQIFGPLRIAKSVYVQPRYASLIKFDPTATDGTVITCPGF